MHPRAVTALVSELKKQMKFALAIYAIILTLTPTHDKRYENNLGGARIFP
jgi:hypothetical protein